MIECKRNSGRVDQGMIEQKASGKAVMKRKMRSKVEMTHDSRLRKQEGLKCRKQYI